MNDQAEDLEPGVTAGWVVVWSRKTMTGTAVPVAQLVDTDGTRHVLPTGDGKPVTIVDDTPPA